MSKTTQHVLLYAVAAFVAYRLYLYAMRPGEVSAQTRSDIRVWFDY